MRGRRSQLEEEDRRWKWYGEVSSKDGLMFCVVDSILYSNLCVYPPKMESYTQIPLVKT